MESSRPWFGFVSRHAQPTDADRLRSLTATTSHFALNCFLRTNIKNVPNGAAVRERAAEIGQLAPLTSDRRTNGSAGERGTVTVRRETPPLPTEFEIACRRALETLLPIDRKLVELCVIDGLYPAEAGRILSLGRSTTKSRLERVLQKLRTNSTLRLLVGLEARVAG
ncbi:MAG: hypothetical protein JWP89_4353 [Schlesneria sp.]|nr:hypothetical protein [Schlesneria sp.]